MPGSYDDIELNDDYGLGYGHGHGHGHGYGHGHGHGHGGGGGGNDDNNDRGDRGMADRIRGLFYSKFDRKPWSRNTWLGMIVGLVVVVIIIVAAVEGSKNKDEPYPDYIKVQYNLAETFQGEDFFSHFNFFTGYDPAQGFVHYVPEAQAREMNLTFASPKAAVLRVDTSVGPDSEPNASTGRFSVRIESKKSYNGGLFLFDVIHAPLGCGAWPALWLTDANNWPMHGEIDVLEATNLGAGGNAMTLHTSKGCTMAGALRKQKDKPLQEDCDASLNSNTGCGVQNSEDSFGGSWNSKGGGVIALEWRAAGIRLWQWPRKKVPKDIKDLKVQQPDPSTWGKATADFPSTNCTIVDHFKNHAIILNIDLCGPLVYHTWGKSTCPSNCTDTVANSPQSFTDAYWEVASFRIFQPSI